jgi:hypothetical protein
LAILPLPRRKSDSAARPKLSKFRAVSKNNSFRPDTNYYFRSFIALDGFSRYAVPLMKDLHDAKIIF